MSSTATPYVIDQYRVIREPGKFQDLAAYAQYFWNAYVDGTYDDELWNDGESVIVLNIKRTTS